jgi:Na+/melibiose symporter-like transporter
MSQSEPVVVSAENEKSPKGTNEVMSFFTKRNILLCLPSLSLTASLIFINVVSIPFYSSLGVPTEMLMLFAVLSRAFDPFVDPLIAYWYEAIHVNDLYEEGLRTHACLVGAVSCAILIGLHLSPPVTLITDASLVTWFAFTYLLFNVSFSFVSQHVTALIWRNSPYEGSCNQSNRTLMALGTDVMQNCSLILLFMVSGFSPSSHVQKMASLQDYDPCYSASGVGTSCAGRPDSGSKLQYDIFNPDVWASSSAEAMADPEYSCRTVYGADGQEVLLSDPNELYTPTNCLWRTSASSASWCVEQYCACVTECSNVEAFNAKRAFMAAAGWLLCAVLLVSVPALLQYLYGWKQLLYPKRVTAAPRSSVVDGTAEECDTLTINNPQNRAQPREQIIPMYGNLLRNKVVRSYLVPLFLDSVVYMTLLGTMVYYVRAVIKPEYTLSGPDCNSATPVFGTESLDWRCQSRVVASLLLSLVAISAVLFSVMWYQLSRFVGAVRVWQLGSLMTALTILALVFSAKQGEVKKALGLGLLMGLGMGSRFLADTVAVDVIHYYEFVSGHQYQHVFAMLKFLFLKIAIVTMHLLPIAVFYDVGFNAAPAAYAKVVVDTGGPVRSIGQIFTIAIPATLSIASFLFKMQLRLVEPQQLDLIAEGIAVCRGVQAQFAVVQQQEQQRQEQEQEQLERRDSATSRGDGGGGGGSGSAGAGAGGGSKKGGRSGRGGDRKGSGSSASGKGGDTGSEGLAARPSGIGSGSGSNSGSVSGSVSSSVAHNRAASVVPAHSHEENNARLGLGLSVSFGVPVGALEASGASDASDAVGQFLTVDPTSGIPYPIDILSPAELRVTQLFCYFDKQSTIDFYSCVKVSSPQIGE